MTSRAKYWASAFAVVAMSQAVAQGTNSPAELPASDYRGNQFVDSRGCAFIRAGVSGDVVWVPRMSQDRRQLCGFMPTFARAAPVEPAPQNSPVIVSTAEPAETAPAEDVPPSPVVVVEQDITDADDQTVLVLDSGDFVSAADVPVPPVQDDIQPNTDEQIAEASAQPEDAGGVTEVVDLQEPDLEPQLDDVDVQAPSAATDEPNTPAAQPVQPVQTASASASAPRQSRNPRQTRRPRSTTPAPPPVMTRAEACAFTARYGVPVRNTTTGLLIECGGADGGPIAHLGEPHGEARLAQGQFASQSDLPQSDYAALQSTATIGATPQNTIAAHPMRHRYVQVATFAVRANADAALAQLRAVGLPSGYADVAQNGRDLRVVVVGPFTQRHDLIAALRAVRAGGYRDAYTRR